MATLPAAQPAYILRGHSSQIHAAQFIRSNSRLVTADAEGWIVVWSLATKRPVAVWKAHEGSILGVSTWGESRFITHGKDNKIVVWKFSEEDENELSKILPVDTAPELRKQPWVLHILNVNTMNFCSFAQCSSSPDPTPEQAEEELLIAVPNTLSSETVDIFHLPSLRRIHTIPASLQFKGGMIMALSIFHHPSTTNQQHLTILAGFESGHTSISTLHTTNASIFPPSWHTTYISHPHTQPILSLCPNPDKSFYLTSSADAIIAKHPIARAPGDVTTASSSNPAYKADPETKPLKILQTKHSGQQDLRIRNDGRVFATAGWDGRVRVYSCKGMKELAVLKWHKEGVYAVAFADVDVDVENEAGEGKGKGEEIVGTNRGGMSVKEERLRRAETSHWLAAGSKDGKVSLWSIY